MTHSIVSELSPSQGKTPHPQHSWGSLLFGTSSELVNANRFRRRRLQAFMSLIDAVTAEQGHCCVLDVGGRMAHWQVHADLWTGKPVSITLINLDTEAAVHPFTCVAGDARELDQFADNSFDIVYSNSVIEHVGPWSDQKKMARAVRRVAPLGLAWLSHGVAKCIEDTPLPPRTRPAECRPAQASNPVPAQRAATRSKPHLNRLIHPGSAS
jgi:hypothetical protein